MKRYAYLLRAYPDIKAKVKMADTSSNTEVTDGKEKGAKEKTEAEEKAAGKEETTEVESLPNLGFTVGKA